MATAIQNAGLALLLLGTLAGIVAPVAYNAAALGAVLFLLGSTLGVAQMIVRERD